MNHPNYLSSQNRDPLNGAAVIDDQGREIPITEAMIRRACELAFDTCVASQYRAMGSIAPWERPTIAAGDKLNARNTPPRPVAAEKAAARHRRALIGA